MVRADISYLAQRSSVLVLRLLPHKDAKEVGEVVCPDRLTFAREDLLPTRCSRIGQFPEVTLAPCHGDPARGRLAVFLLLFTGHQIVHDPTVKTSVAGEVAEHRLKVQIPIGKVEDEEAI